MEKCIEQTITKYGEKKILKICNVCLILCIVLSFVYCGIFTNECSALALCVELILAMIFYLVWLFYSWQKNIVALMCEYKQGNVISGGLAMLLALAVPFIVMQILANYEVFPGSKEFFSNMASLLITITPAFIALMGVQYTVAIQERNRREDLRLGAKPFLAIQCCVENIETEDLQNNESVIKTFFKIKNISSNIMIPISVESTNDNETLHKFDYKPLTKNKEFTQEVKIISKEKLLPQHTVCFRYADVYNNEYLAEIEFALINSYELSKTRVLSDKLCINEFNEQK